MSHYPSWGSETRSGRARASLPRTAHYPSMGIGTASSSRRRPGCSDLITPHGDRKPQSTGFSVRSTPISLPLMGIGNFETSGPAQARAQRLITPHGDRKRGVGPVDVDAAGLITPHGDRKPRDRKRAGRWRPAAPRGRSHYPSWGSETPQRDRDGRQPVNLITPHGDRKRSPALGRIPASAPHYPSWGSETCDSHRLPAATPHSLPLMGIGNLHEGRALEEVAPDPLPLMGIGNPAMRGGCGPALCAHYPSWGSETRAAGGLAGRRRAHYPSWGSETPLIAVQTAPQELELITPHGDRKRPRPRDPRRGRRRLITPHGDRKLRQRPGPLHPPPPVLITPHGDRKPAGGTRRGRAATALITPHGDRKPQHPPTPPSASGPHYPS